MKTSNRNKLLGLALTGSFSLLGASNAFAAADDLITNRATLNYEVSGTAQTLIESSDAGNSTAGVGNGGNTSFREDKKILFTVAHNGSTGSVATGGTGQSVTYTLTNSGNSSQGFLLKGINSTLTAVDPHGGTNDAFDASAITTFVEEGTTPGYQVGEDTVAYVASLAAAASIEVHVVSTIPGALADDVVAVMTLIAHVATDGSDGTAGTAIVRDDNSHESLGGNGFTNGTADITAGVNIAAIPDDPTNMETVFADLAGEADGTGVADNASTAVHSAVSSYTVQSAVITVQKTSVTLRDPINGSSNPKSIPGAYVTYTVTVSNAGPADADLTTLADDLVAALLLDQDFVNAAGAASNAAGDSIEIIHVDNATTLYCTGDLNDTDSDGCGYTAASLVTAGGVVDVDIFEAMSEGAAAADATLAAGESLTIKFNVIVQ